MNRHQEAALYAEGQRKLARGDFSRLQAEMFDVGKLAFPAQLKAIRDPAPSRAICCGRQSGKTEGAAYDLTDVAERNPGAFQLFIAPNRLWAKRIVWQPLKSLNDRFNLRAIASESDLSVRYPNGHIVALMGADTDRERAKVRGRAYIRIRIDEAQAFPYWLDDFIREDLRPAQRNVRGQLTVQGTPPASLEHPWFKRIWSSPEYSKHSWNITHWPKALYKRMFGQSAEQALADDLKDRGVGPEDVTFRREMLGEFLADESALAYRFDAAKNLWQAAPPEVHHTVIGVDLGWHDATVVSVLGWAEEPTCYQLHEEVHEGITLLELAGILKRLGATWQPAVCMVDSGGNRQGYETIKEQLLREGAPLRLERRPVLPVADQVGLVNQALQSGRLRLKDGSRAASDMRLVTWAKGIAGTKLDDGFHSDAIPALTYAYQAAVPLLPSPRESPKPPQRNGHPPGFDPDEWARRAASDRPWWELADRGIVDESPNPLFDD